MSETATITLTNGTTTLEFTAGWTCEYITPSENSITIGGKEKRQFGDSRYKFNFGDDAGTGVYLTTAELLTLKTLFNDAVSEYLELTTDIPVPMSSNMSFNVVFNGEIEIKSMISAGAYVKFVLDEVI